MYSIYRYILYVVTNILHVYAYSIIVIVQTAAAADGSGNIYEYIINVYIYRNNNVRTCK